MVLEMGGGTNSPPKIFFQVPPHFLAVPLLVIGYVLTYFSLWSLYKHPIGLHFMQVGLDLSALLYNKLYDLMQPRDIWNNI